MSSGRTGYGTSCDRYTLPSMSPLVRLIVMWLIAVALPIQGATAATLLHCRSTAPAPATGAHEHPAHHHEAQAGHGEAAADHQHAGPVSHDGVPSTPDHHHGGGKSSCSACASCCSAAALPAMPIVLASQDLEGPVFTVPELPVVVFLTDGPERPPRTILS